MIMIVIMLLIASLFSAQDLTIDSRKTKQLLEGVFNE
tara:strand:+ start:440 stop:550 length:111 start_codon:yes stop_codon:yes gene_type:complete